MQAPYQYIQTELIKVKLTPDYKDKSILDIGGGGEGFIGRLYGKNVIAIDKRKDELDETNNEAIKLVMDAEALGFTDCNFDVVTLFYSLMYMSHETKKRVLAEAYRVLKPGGIIEVWDLDVPSCESSSNQVYVAQLSVEFGGNTVTTGYGVGLNDKAQSYKSINELVKACGFIKIRTDYKGPDFKLTYQK